MRGCVFGVGLISHDAKRAGSNIGDRANCDRQRRSFASHSSNEGFIGCPFFIRAPAPLSKLVDDISRAPRPSSSSSPPSFFLSMAGGGVFSPRDIPVAPRLLDNRRGEDEQCRGCFG